MTDDAARTERRLVVLQVLDELPDNPVAALWAYRIRTQPDGLELFDSFIGQASAAINRVVTAARPILEELGLTP